jgi:hypothetical protein
VWGVDPSEEALLIEAVEAVGFEAGPVGADIGAETATAGGGHKQAGKLPAGELNCVHTSQPCS